MTVQTNNNSISYVGNGSTVHFDYDYLILNASHLKVYFGDVLQTSGYVVSGVSSQTGGTVAFAVAPPNGTNITLIRDVPFLQLTDYQPYDAFPAESHERALDLLTMMAQQLKDSTDRSMQHPVGGNKWDAKGNEIINVGTGSSGTSAANIDQVKYLIASEVGDDPSASASVRSREALRRSYAEAGYTLVAGSFEVGGTITTATDALLYEADGRAYSYGGSLPKAAPAGSTPSTAGGIGPTAWSSKEGALLKSTVYSNDDGLWSSVAKKLGLTIVGTFEGGCNVTAKSQAVLLRSAGQLYVRTSNDSVVVPPNSTPISGWSIVKDEVSLMSSVIAKTDLASQSDAFFNKTYPPIKIVAHRGFSFIGMENTFMAFQKAKNLGADMLECDIQVSSDGIPVIFHDDTTDRLMSGTGDVLSMTYATMAAMTFVGLAGTPYKTEIIPRLVDICEWLKRNDAIFLAEFKRLRGLADVKLIIDIVKQYEVLDKFVWQCNDTAILAEARKYAPKNKIAFFSDTFIQAKLDELSLMGNAIYMVQYAALNADSTIGGKCHAAGVELATYTNNNSYTLRNLRRHGLQYIITDVNLGRLS